MSSISSAIGPACRAYRKAYGNTETTEDWDKQSEFCDQDSGVISARAAYNALRDESLAINPFAPGHIVDPDLHNEYSEIYKYECGPRPRGYTNVAEMKAYSARRSDENTSELQSLMRNS